MDKAVYMVAIFAPLMTIPQILDIWVDKNAQDVSLTTWVLYTFAALFWLLYGIAHRNKPIIIAHILWIIVQMPIVIGVLIY